MGLRLVLGAVVVATNSSPAEKLKDGLLSVQSQEADKLVAELGGGEQESTVSITVVGASGDLAKKKIFPALFALYYEGCLPQVRERERSLHVFLMVIKLFLVVVSAD